MARGGTDIAIGGEASALFSNPAGLAAMYLEEDLELEIVNFGVGLSGGFLGFYTTYNENADLLATDTEAFIDAMTPHKKSNFHLSTNDFTSLSYRGEEFALSIGLLAGIEANFIPHLSLGADGLIEAHLRTLTILAMGASYDVTYDLSVGVGAKIINGFNKAASINLVSTGSIPSDFTTLGDYTAVVYDVGALYFLDALIEELRPFEPLLGVSVQNIGGISMPQFYADIPMTVNVGLTLRPVLPLFEDWRFAVDYIDVLNAYDAKLDADIFKRLRLGMTANVFRNDIVQLAGSFGAYNSAPTFGIQARWAVLELSLATYAEEIGAFAGQNQDRRYQLSIVTGF